MGAGDLLVEAGYTAAHNPDDARMEIARKLARDALEHALKVVSTD
jgi:hypothetical protein